MKISRRIAQWPAHGLFPGVALAARGTGRNKSGDQHDQESGASANGYDLSHDPAFRGDCC